MEGTSLRALPDMKCSELVGKSAPTSELAAPPLPISRRATASSSARIDNHHQLPPLRRVEPLAGS